MWIEMAFLDPDLDPYWEFGFRIRIQNSQNDVQKGKNLKDFKLKKALKILLKA